MNKKKYITFAYIALNIIIIAVIGLLDPHLKDIGEAFYRIRLPWIIGGILCMVFFWFMDAVILKYCLTTIFEPTGFKECITVTLIGHYYHSVTPFASGGQPAQIYYLAQFGVPAGYSTSALIIKYLIYQTVLSLYCSVAFAFKSRFILSHTSVVFWISLIGFIINAGAVVLIYSLSVNYTLIRKIVLGILKFFYRIRIVKDLEKIKSRLETVVEDFHRSICMISGNYRAIFSVGAMTIVQLIFYFSITYFIYRAFGLNDSTLWDIIFVQSFLYLAVSYFPTPGAMGASEGGFYIFFQWFFPSNLIFVSMLFWRLISYYMNILVGGSVILVRSIRNLTEYNQS